IQETRLWNPNTNSTASMRGKEEAHDYRYFPDPDLVPLIVDDAWIQEVQSTMPELPEAKKARFIDQYGLSEYDAGILTASLDMANFFEETVRPLENIKQAANWTMTTLMGMLNAKGLEISASPVSAQSFCELLGLIEKGTINAKAAKTVFEKMAESGKDPKEIVKEQGLEQVSDHGALEVLVDEVISENPDEVQAYRDGKTKLFSFFMGQIMKKTRGKADPKVVTPLLKSKL
ncbi:MAG: Asp-tRNA(Asn)/Glu-tRNA(Gln) amidotransferase GatCAB subunit B, partial [Desulfobacterales bacterium]